MQQTENSLLYWYPKVKDLGIPTPETIIVELKNQHSLMDVCEGDFSSLEPQWNEILESARKIGFPLFMRTDEYSGKHNWKNTCYVEKEEDLKQHIFNLFEDSFLADMLGLPIRALVFRKFIPMKNLFNAFYGEMPVNPEIRFFVKDGEVLCWHWYWVEEAIERGTPEGKLPSDWRQKIEQAKQMLSDSKIVLLNIYASKVAKQIRGYWSVDFCLSKTNECILIDMALGNNSWHPECKFNSQRTEVNDVPVLQSSNFNIIKW